MSESSSLKEALEQLLQGLEQEEKEVQAKLKRAARQAAYMGPKRTYVDLSDPLQVTPLPIRERRYACWHCSRSTDSLSDFMGVVIGRSTFYACSKLCSNMIRHAHSRKTQNP
jgi:hypothetical protein